VLLAFWHIWEGKGRENQNYPEVLPACTLRTLVALK
jgi:hypothetical protein